MKIVYESKTGHTEKYAKMLAKKLGIEAVKLRDFLAGKEEKEEIVFMGWLCANIIKGYSKIREKCTIKCIGAVGMAEDTEMNTNNIKTANKITGTELFYLRGGIDFQKLKGISKLIMKAIIKSEIKNRKIEGDTETVLTVGIDYVKEENLDRMYSYLGVK